MAAAKPKNVYQKLQEARLKFSQKEVAKSGKNIQVGYFYIELEDIVPVAEEIFSEVGLILIPTIEGNEVFGTVVNVDDPKDIIIFTIPYTPVDPIISNQGKQVTNNMQAFGASVTYMRRYLWQIVLDIVVPDEIDSSNAKKPEAPKPKAPATPEKREEVKKNLTNVDGKPDELQIQALKSSLKKLLELDPDKEEFVQQVATLTNGFKSGTRKEYEQLITKINDMCKEYKKAVE